MLYGDPIRNYFLILVSFAFRLSMKPSGMMEIMGYANTEQPEEADVLIFNTCAIRKAAEEHVFGEIGMLKGLKETNEDRIFCLCGCMAQEESVVSLIQQKYPQDGGKP